MVFSGLYASYGRGPGVTPRCQLGVTRTGIPSHGRRQEIGSSWQALVAPHEVLPVATVGRSMMSFLVMIPMFAAVARQNQTIPYI